MEKTERVALVYQAGIANVYRVRVLSVDPIERGSSVSLYQGDFRGAEMFVRGALAAGALGMVAACNQAGSVRDLTWSLDLENQPFSDSFGALCTCAVGPGKFEAESALTALAWGSAMISGQDATTGGDGEVTDWFRAPFNFDADDEAVSMARGAGFCAHHIREALEDEAAGLALWQDSQGFLYSATFATREAFEEALGKAEEADQEAADQEEA